MCLQPLLQFGIRSQSRNISVQVFLSRGKWNVGPRNAEKGELVINSNERPAAGSRSD